MAVSYVGAGTYASGNNASLSPGIPAGMQAGDLMILIASIGEDTSSGINTPSGWTAAQGGISNGTAVETRLQAFYRAWQSGDTAPTVTFSGGGSQDPTQARIYGFRGARVAGTVTDRLTVSSNNFPNQPIFYAVTGTYEAGDMLLVYRAATNDDTPDTNGAIGSLTPITQVNDTTTQGRDAALNVVMAVSDGSGSGYAVNAPYLSGGSDGLTDALVIHQVRVSSNTGSGGAVVGGSATASYRQTRLSVSGSGGAILGGEAGFATRRPTFPYSGTGGVVAGGSADAAYRQTILSVTPSGGLVVGGAAQVTLIQPAAYHIDPYNGSDANTGLSWAQAFKSFHPISEGDVSIGAGDRVKIAKTPDEGTQGFFASQVLTAHVRSGQNFGWKVSSFSSPIFDAANLKIIDQLTVSSGWTIPDGSRYGNGTVQTYPYSGSWHYFTLFGTFTADFLLAYKPLAATLDLSGYNRLEARFAAQESSGSQGTPWEVKLCLCSDAAGATSLLEIPLTHSQIKAGVIAYDGALPAGVNSISLRSLTQGSSTQYTYMFFSLIACRDYGQAGYFGHFTEVRFGDHEGAVWTAVHAFQVISSAQYATLAYANTGPASVHNTNMTFYHRQAVGWNRTVRYDSTINDWPFVGRFTLREVMDPVIGIVKTTFNLIDRAGILSAPIEVVGGYDPGTNTITGKTAIIHRTNDGYPGIGNYVPPFTLAESGYWTFKNIDVWANQVGIFGIQDTNDGVRFENCQLTFVGQTNGMTAANNVMYKWNTEPLMRNAYFKNCTGNALYLVSTNQGTAPKKLSAVAQFTGLTLEGCILSPYCGMPQTTSGGQGNNTPAILVGDLKIYCIPTTARIDQLVTDSYCFTLPAFASGQAGTVYVYGGGACFMNPVGPADGQIGGTYTFPELVLENTFPLFASVRQLDNNSGDYANGGDVEYMEVPEITITTSNAWNDRQSSTPTTFWVQSLIGVHNSRTPPLHVRKLTHTGVWYTSSGDRRTAIVYSYGGAVQVTDVVLTGTGTEFDHILADNQTASDESQGVYGERLVIIDGLTKPNKAYVQNPTYMVGGHGTGLANGIYDFRGVNINNTSASVPLRASVAQAISSRVRFKGCTIINSGGAGNYYSNPAAPNLTTSYMVGQNGFDSGILWEDCTMTPPASFTTGMTTSTSTEFATSVVDLNAPLTITKSSAVAQGTYWYNFGYIEKDFTNFPTGLVFSWKVWSRFRIALPLTYNIPLATVPVRVGKLVTITLQCRRSSTSIFAGLVVHHNGCKGFLTPQDYAEVIQLMTAAVDTWQTVQVQFTAQRSGIIDIAFTRFGVEGGNAWFTDLRVVES